MLRKILFIFLAGLLLIVIVLFINAYRLPSRQMALKPVASVDISANAFEHLSKAITLPTTSLKRGAPIDTAAFIHLHQHLRNSFPLVHSQLKLRKINQFSLLYYWKGSSPQLKPILWAAHTDVVPVEKGTESKWKHPPFAGNISNGFIWGRGALDDKMNVLGMLEAVEHLLKNGYVPKRSIYLAFGHDEEISGHEGAKKIAQYLIKRGVQLEYVLDEGLFVLKGLMPGVAKPVAYVGVAEKGYANVKLSVAVNGGHSSRPPLQTPVRILSQAIVDLETHQFPASIQGATGELMDFLAPEMDLGFKLVFANRWLFSSVIKNIMAGEATSNAVLRTTIAPTMLQGSPKPNVMPANPSAVINLRLSPGETKKTLLAHFKKVIDNPKVKVKILNTEFNIPVPLSDVKAASFQKLQKTIHQLFPEALVAPALMVAGTDSKHYQTLSKNIYRFSPLYLENKEIDSFHGTNERISKKSYQQLIRFYIQLIKNSD
ncbi:M20 family peptidase [Microscilla marina]|uniref:Carboxypeptidase S n=1 Tax=Microscilla marina ATCC 23134 TaxID=313606 RepID=A1ZQY0_MICM2|nr:M20 family peptidase [Microscilla marina]EAY27285.1 carboxypeptidase S [Microscilla marina ATCC 23134]